MFDAKSKYVFGSEAAVDAALKNGLIDAYDVFFLDEAGFGWIDRNGEKVVLKNKKQVSVVDFLPDAGEYEVIYIYNSNMFLWNGVGYTDLSISGKLDETALSDAINTALELAKESGEFNGNDYVLTDDDRNEIAELAAKLVEIPNMEGVRKKLIVPFEQLGHSSYSAVISGQELKDAIESGMDIVLEWNGASYEMVDYHTGLSDENGRFVRAVFEKFYPDTLINEIITIDCHMDRTTGSGTVDIVNVGENLSKGGIDVIGAAAGQTVIISEVDESGTPVSWEPVDFPEDQVQTDWNQTDRTMPDYIKNRPMSMSYVYDIGSVESLAAGEIVKINDLSTAVGGVYEAFKISHMQPEGSGETMVSECNIKIGDNMLPQAPVVLYFEAALDNNNYTMRDGSRFRVYVIMNVNTLTEDYKNLFQTKGVYLEDVGLVTGKYSNIMLRMRVYNQLDPRYIPSKIARVSEIPQVDNTLSIEGAVADAKAVGDAISQISSDEIYILGDGETTNDAPESAVMVIDPEGYADIPNSGGNADYVGVEPAKMDRPKIFFGAPLQKTKDEIVTVFSYRSETLSFDCYAEIKAQGNSTMNWPKKNQTVKLYKDAACTEKFKVDFKGWGKQNKFVMKANWRDLTHVRDIVSVRLEGDCMRSNPDFDELPELLRTSPNLGGIDGFPVVVYAAGVYQGRYMWNIPKDKWMTNMDDELEEHCILCSEDYNSSCFRAAANINGNDWTDEIHDTVPTSIKTRWNEIISFVMNSTDDEFVANLDSYIKVSTLIDRHIMGMYSCDFDGYGKNQLYLTYDGQQWYAGRYDKDGTWGNYWTGNNMLSSNYGREQYEDMISGRPGNLLFIRLEQLFWQRLQNRWAELKDSVLSIPNTINRFRELYDITPPYVIDEDYASTTANGAFTSIPNKTTCTIQQIEKFVTERHAWMDKYMASLPGGEVGPDEPDVPEEPETIPCTGITLDKTELTFDGDGTQTITATVTPADTTDTVVWVSSDPNVASISVDGNVCTAQSVGNGDATITVTCGDYSASCAVSVSGIVGPLYPFENGTIEILYTKGGSDVSGVLTITNGNHINVSMTSVTYVHFALTELPESPCYHSDDGISHVKNRESLFSLKAGDVVRTVVTYSDVSTFRDACSIFVVKANSNQTMNLCTNTKGNIDNTITITSDTNVAAISGWWGMGGDIIDCDVEIYVNNVRYV